MSHPSAQTPRQSRDFQARHLIAFFVLTYAITWGIIGFYLFFQETAIAWFGEASGSHPFFFLATWAPAIAAIGLVLWRSGWAGFKAYLSRLLLWRCSPAWAAFLLIGIPLVFIAGSLIKGGPVLSPLPPGGLGTAIAFLFMMALLGPVEEFGWRGFAQPLLQRHVAPIWAGLIIGVIWGLWHLPAFSMSGTVQSNWSFAPFFFGSVLLAVIVTPLFNRSGGSILLPMLFHWQLINPFWPDAQPWDSVILAAVALVIVWLNRHTMFTRSGATEVVPRNRR